jgi:DNA-binding transcriptional ArsR family regulator
MPEPRPNHPTIRVTDPKALRALAHPIRLSLMAMLRTLGPLTATKAGELLGESSASTSFHLRQLAKYGLVEEASGGRGRERPWQATRLFTDVPDTTNDPKVAAAAGLVRGVVAQYYFEMVQRWLAVRDEQPEEWQLAAQFGDTMIYVTADELAELGREYEELIDRYLDRLTDPSLRPDGARLVSVLRIANPYLLGLGERTAPGEPDVAGPAEARGAAES